MSDSVVSTKTSKGNFVYRLSTFIKKHKRVLIVVGIFSILATGGLVVALATRSNQPKIATAENIAAEEVTDKFDYIYNPNENTLAAATISGEKYLELLSTDGTIVDYIVSPDKTKIVYSISPKDFKNKIFSPNVDITKFSDGFPAVAFLIYEYDLLTGENKLLWTREEIELPPTTQEIYWKKQEIGPDSYTVYTDWYSVSYPVSYGGYEDVAYGWYPVSYITPVSYFIEVDDVERGYNTTYLPYDLSIELNNRAIKFIGFDSDSTKFAMLLENKIIYFKGDEKTEFTISSSNFCTSGSYGKSRLENKTVLINYNYCYNDYDKSFAKVLKIEGNIANDIIDDYKGKYSDLELVFGNQKYGLFTNYDRATYKISLIFINFDTGEDKILFEIAEGQRISSVDSEEPMIAITSNSNEGNELFKISRFNELDNNLIPAGEIVLPSDISDISYNNNTGSISYFRRYMASNESVIEYRIVNIQNKEEKELKTIKVSNSSVLFYNPKLIWLNN